MQGAEKGNFWLTAVPSDKSPLQKEDRSSTSDSPGKNFENPHAGPMPGDPGSGVCVGAGTGVVQGPCRDSDGALDVGAFLGLPSPPSGFSLTTCKGGSVPTRFMSLPQPHSGTFFGRRVLAGVIKLK